MKKFLADLIQRLTSRKFLLAVSAAALLAANKQWNELVGVVIAYIGAEGIGDAAQRFSEPKAQAAQANLDETKLQILGAEALPDTGVDRSTLVPGNGSDVPMAQ